MTTHHAYTYLHVTVSYMLELLYYDIFVRLTLSVRMAERSKAPDSSIDLLCMNVSRVECSGPLMWAWVRIPLLTYFYFIFQRFITNFYFFYVTMHLLMQGFTTSHSFVQ